MARINPLQLTLEPSPSTDVVAYRMYYVPANQPLDYASPHVEFAVVAQGEGLVIDMATVTELASEDGLFDVAFTSVDDGGNESDMGANNSSVPFDFTAPLPPVSAAFSNA